MPPQRITPPHPKAGADPHPSAPARRLHRPRSPDGRRTCRRCRASFPQDSFLLWEHPKFANTATDSSSAVRFWCEECIAKSAFARHVDVKAAFRARDTARETAARTRATATLALRLSARAATDPVFAAALTLAATTPRADLEALV